MSDATTEGVLAFGAPARPSALRRWGHGVLACCGPRALRLGRGGVLLLVLGKNPLAFYWTTLQSGLLTGRVWSRRSSGWLRCCSCRRGSSSPFRRGCGTSAATASSSWPPPWSGGLGLTMVNAMPFWLALIMLCIIGSWSGAAWTVVPAFLKAYYGMNEIITTLMMAFIGIGVANLLIKGPFSPRRDRPADGGHPVQQPAAYIPGTNIHVGVIVALVVLISCTSC